MKNELSYVMVKPDGIQRGLIGEIIQRIERTGLKLVAFKMVVPTEEQCWNHYNKDDAWFLEKGTKVFNNKKESGQIVDKEPIEYGRDIVRALVKFMTSGPVVAMIWQGNQAVGIVKKLVGSTEPLTSDVGTIRGDFTLDSYALSMMDDRAVRNLIHCSDKPEEALREIDIWFDKKEIIKYRLINEQILYDVNLDGILE
ncbi:MAG: nucleoside-diphosphate kinase [Patescibacteria group bacterium]